jgi:hypothetical protein
MVGHGLSITNNLGRTQDRSRAVNRNEIMLHAHSAGSQASTCDHAELVGLVSPPSSLLSTSIARIHQWAAEHPILSPNLIGYRLRTASRQPM